LKKSSFRITQQRNKLLPKHTGLNNESTVKLNEMKVLPQKKLKEVHFKNLNFGTVAEMIDQVSSLDFLKKIVQKCFHLNHPRV
jgi:hypothetical protein